MATAGADRLWKLWDTENQPLLALKEQARFKALAFSPDGKTLACGHDDGNVALADLTQGGKNHLFRGRTGAVLAVAFSPDSRVLATGGNDRTVKLWDIATGQEKHSLVGHTAAVRCVAFNPDGRRLVSRSTG